MDANDFKILKALDRNSRISNSHIARQLGLTPNAVSDRIDRLLKDGVIEKFTLAFNCHRIGYRRYIGILSPLQPDPFPVLKEMSEIDYIWENLDGSFTFDFLCRDSKHLEKFLTKLNSSGIDLPEYSELRMHLPDDIPFSQLDWKILHNIFNNSRASQKEIAQVLGINDKTVFRRLERMSSMRLVEFSPSINFEKISGYVTGVLVINTKGDSKNTYLDIKNNPSIKYWRNAGSVEPGFVLFIYERNLTALYEMKLLMKDRPDVKSAFLTIIVRNWLNSDLILDSIKTRL